MAIAISFRVIYVQIDGFELFDVDLRGGWNFGQSAVLRVPRFCGRGWWRFGFGGDGGRIGFEVEGKA